MNAIDVSILLSAVLASTIPTVIASIGEAITDKAGVINLSLDETILLTAMAAFAVSFQTHSVFLGFTAAALIGVAAAVIITTFSLFFDISQVSIGFVLTLFFRDLVYFLGNSLSRINGPQLTPFALPYLKNLPIVVPILFNIIGLYTSVFC